jgi:hypothetical protein
MRARPRCGELKLVLLSVASARFCPIAESEPARVEAGVVPGEHHDGLVAEELVEGGERGGAHIEVAVADAERVEEVAVEGPVVGAGPKPGPVVVDEQHVRHLRGRDHP